MHLMVGDQLTLYRHKCTSADMQAYIITHYTGLIKAIEHIFSKMQPCSRCGNRAFHLRIKCLVTLQIQRFCISFKVWRDRNTSANVKNFRERGSRIPFEFNHRAIIVTFIYKFCPQIERKSSRMALITQKIHLSALPALGITYNYIPRTLRYRREA